MQKCNSTEKFDECSDKLRSESRALEELSRNGSNNASQIDVNDSMVLVASGNLFTNQRRSDIRPKSDKRKRNLGIGGKSKEGSPAQVKPRREEKAIPSVLEWVHEYHCMIDVRQDNTRQILPHLTLHLAESDFGSSMITETRSFPTSPSLSVPAKRCPGRPKGSCNKKQRVHSEELPSEPKPRGRPRGSGPKLPPPTSLSIRLGNEISPSYSLEN
ncbi:hypothetical protein R3P38DRAFT_2786755 [Favolaschia claudopus]|uniref:Uncharacterized protein n=1 Tax=Favolaschia claudopus TaxID=2862362 RepID=A0AAW0ASU7_9AGAR